MGSRVAAGFPQGTVRTGRSPRRLVPILPAGLREGRGVQWGGRRSAGDLVQRRGQRAVPRDGGRKVPGTGEPSWCPGKAWNGRGHRARSRCPVPTSLSSFPAETTSCHPLTPRPRAQELRGEVLGRSFAIWGPDDDAAVPGPLATAGRNRAARGSRVRTLVRMTRRPQLFFFFFACS